jgi:hypothetical protein
MGREADDAGSGPIDAHRPSGVIDDGQARVRDRCEQQ